MEQNLLTPEEVAKVLRLSKYTVYEMVKRGELNATRIGRKVRISKQDVEAFIQNSSSSKTSPKFDLSIETNRQQENKTTVVHNDILFMGSHDLSIDYVVEYIKQHKQLNLIPAFVGSMDGLLQLYNDKIQFSGCHLFDEETGEYNFPIVKRLFSGEKVYIVEFVRRNLGWIVAKDNPKGLSGWQDLARNDLNFVNRQKGSGTRIILDYYIKKLDIKKEEIQGYPKIERTHYGTASSVARGEVDLALGTESAARTFGLDFVPLVKERYDFVMKEAFYHSKEWALIHNALSSPELREKINSLGGYEVKQMGDLIEEVN